MTFRDYRSGSFWSWHISRSFLRLIFLKYLQKPEKIYLQNTNLAWLLSENKPDTGNLRETFFSVRWRYDTG